MILLLLFDIYNIILRLRETIKIKTLVNIWLQYYN